MTHPAIRWPPARLHIVTGKGGTGKTTVAAALAIALASNGGRTLLIEVEGRQGIARLFDLPPLPYAEQRIAVAPEDGEVKALAIDTTQALLDYLETFYRLRRAGKLLQRMGAIDFVTTIAPGMRDVLLAGKVKEATTRVDNGKRTYDAVVLDAPPTGRIARFLNTTGEVATLAKVGPIRAHSEGVTALLRSSQTAIHMVTVLEEMPVQEAADTIEELRESGFHPASVIVNMTQPAGLPTHLPEADRTPERIAVGVGKVGLDPELAHDLSAEAAEYARWSEVGEHNRQRVQSLGLPCLELPLLPGPMDLAGIYELAQQLRKSGVS